MAVILNNVLSDRYANSYIAVGYCDDYWNAHYNTVKANQWSALDSTQKITLLIKACRVIETARFTVNARLLGDYHLHYDRHTQTAMFFNEEATPVKYTYYQSLQFPRNLDRDPTTGELYVPEPIKMAQCEQAVYSLNFDEAAVASRMQGIGDETATIGSIRIHQRFTAGGNEWSPSALEYVKPFLVRLSHSVKRR
jgi:hypothetical protein